MTRGGKREGAGRPHSPNKKKKVSFRLSPKTIDKIREKAVDLDVSQVDVIEKAVDLL